MDAVAEVPILTGTSAVNRGEWLVNPAVDVGVAGGLSIFAYFALRIAYPASDSTDTIDSFAYYASFAVNFPHFLASYQLLYLDHSAAIFRKTGYFWAGVIVPLAIFATLFFGIRTGSSTALTWIVQTMFLTVGWHYVKQAFGVMIVTSAVQKKFFSRIERFFLLFNLYSLWAMSWIHANLDGAKADFSGVQYSTFALARGWMTAAYVSTAASFLIVAGLLIQRYRRTGWRPAYSSLAAFASLYIWYLPALDHPAYFYLIPMFHSLQYLFFVYALKRNEFCDGLTKRSPWVFLAGSAVLGLVFFKTLPDALDSRYPVGFANGPSLWLFSFSAFLNLHHYFIDNVIWRKDNERLGRLTAVRPS